LLKVAADTLITIAADPNHLGARIPQASPLLPLPRATLVSITAIKSVNFRQNIKLPLIKQIGPMSRKRCIASDPAMQTFSTGATLLTPL
jgi:hypothetical protein